MPRCTGCGAACPRPTAAAQVLVCPGIHSVLAALISQLARPGELICVEALTYPGLKAIAAQLGVQLHAAAARRRRARHRRLRACVQARSSRRRSTCNPTLPQPHHRAPSRARAARRWPTSRCATACRSSRTTPTRCCRAGAAADRHLRARADLLHHRLLQVPRAPGCAVPTCCAPSDRQSQRLAGALRATTVMASPVTNALATRWVRDGTADAMLQAIRDESQARQAMARRHLGAPRRRRAAGSLPPVAARCASALERRRVRVLPAHAGRRQWWRAPPSAPTATRPTRCASAWAGRSRATTATRRCG